MLRKLGYCRSNRDWFCNLTRADTIDISNPGTSNRQCSTGNTNACELIVGIIKLNK